ncbi:hypothetical protein OV090_10365 [Nannocystis sp. RBIL2]|uniref:protein kinase domain-containing protein n=1 Tax=Nannocystis sp. RBIL2 TaxID=2996788 RepID=UPI00226D768C|nr:hypothetical protein [Nannocystis sp. RBIL2]MCY1065166.1 hypothetical protein [Nannocystis sp. RBIL2]
MTPLRAEGPAQVFVAVDHQAGREVELTLFDPSLAQADPWAAFARLIIAATAAKIPGLVLPRGVTRTAPTPPYCVTDLQMARGFDRQVEQGPTPWRRALTLCERVAEIVERAHTAAGAAHRALTPARCVITARGDVKVLDFGLAELGPGHAADSPYRAPELPAAAGPRCDVYAIGVMLYELLAGQRAPAGPLPRWSAPADANREVEALVARATATDPDQRHADPAALRAALRALLDADDKSTAAKRAAAHAAAEAEAGAAGVRAPEAPETAAARRAAEAEAAAMDGPPLLPGGINLSSGTSRPPTPPLARAADMSERPSQASPPASLMNLSAGTSGADSFSAASSSSLASPASSGSRLAGSSSPSRSYPTLAGDPSSASSSSSLASPASSGSRLAGSSSPSRSYPTLAGDSSSAASSSSLASPASSGSRLAGSSSPSRSYPTLAGDSSPGSSLRGSTSPSRAHPTVPPVDASPSSSSLTSRPRAPGASPSRSHPTVPPAPASASSSSNHERLPGSASPSRSHPTLASAQAQASASSSSLSRARTPGSASPSRSHPTLSSAQAQASASSLSRPRPPGAPPSRSYPTLAPPGSPAPGDRTEILAQSTIVAAERARTGAHPPVPPVPAADRTEITPRRSVRGLPGASRRDDAGSLHSSDLGDSTVIARAPTDQHTEELPVPAFARRGPGDPPTEQLPVPAFADARGRHVDPPTDRIPVPAFADATQVLRADDLPLPAPASDPDATRIWRRPPDPSEIVEPARPAPESTMMLPTTGETVLFHHQAPVPRAMSLMASIRGWSLRKKLLVVNLGLALVILFGVLAAVAC